ncbi:hypothetical protein PRIC2_009519 [Phytophthora ramorum]
MILNVLIKHDTFDSFEKSVGRDPIFELGGDELEELSQSVYVWQSALVKWFSDDINEHPVVNLTLPAMNVKKEDVPIVLDQCHLSWEGSLERARIFAHRKIRDVTLDYQRELRETQKVMEPFSRLYHNKVLVYLWEPRPVKKRMTTSGGVNIASKLYDDHDEAGSLQRSWLESSNQQCCSEDLPSGGRGPRAVVKSKAAAKHLKRMSNVVTQSKSKRKRRHAAN